MFGFSPFCAASEIVYLIEHHVNSLLDSFLLSSEICIKKYLFLKIQLLITSLKKILVVLVCPMWRLSLCAFLRYQCALGCFRDFCELAVISAKGQNTS